MSKALAQVAERLSISTQELENIIINTIMPGGKCSNEQLITFLAVANEYKLNILTKEIYAFPAKGGGIQPIVSIDGWLKIINGHPDFNGMTFHDNFDGGDLISVTCNIYKKGIDHPISITEYMSECKRNSEPWNKWPARMLRHKAAIQGGRYAFGLSGIIDPDEADRFKEAGAIKEKDAGPATEVYGDEQFNEMFEKWKANIEAGKKTPEQIIEYLDGKVHLTDSQKQKILDIKVGE